MTFTDALRDSLVELWYSRGEVDTTFVDGPTSYSVRRPIYPGIMYISRGSGRYDQVTVEETGAVMVGSLPLEMWIHW